MRSVAWLKMGVVAGACAVVGLWLPPRVSSDVPIGTLEVYTAVAIQPDAAQLTSPIDVRRVPAAQEAPMVHPDTLRHDARRAGAGPTQVRAFHERFPGATTLIGASRKELAIALQRELVRIGCYAGAVDGSWGAGSKRAMGAFVGRTNSSLPVEEPDHVLLALVQNYKGSCKAGTVRVAALGDAAVRALENPAPVAEAKASARPRNVNSDKRTARSAKRAGSERPAYVFAERMTWRDRVFESK